MSDGGWVLGVIGGSGLYEIAGLEQRAWRRIDSPWGAPSDALLFGALHGVPVRFLPRHGRGHKVSPSHIDYRANIDALKRAGCTDLVSLSAVGSLRKKLAPGDFVVVDQYVDRTFARQKSFFGEGVVAHVSMAHPVCPRLSRLAAQAAEAAGAKVREGGTYLCMEGPQFSTRAESDLYRDWGCHVIGMTNMPEAKLAREAELPYASVAMVTDYDCWHEEHEHVQVADIVRVMHENADRAKATVAELCRLLAETPRKPSPIDTVLDAALITPPEHRDPALMAKLDAVAARILSLEDIAMNLRDAIRTIPDYPKPGIMFRDITTLLGDAQAFRQAIEEMVAPFAGERIEKVAGIEARGFIFGAAIAHQLSAGFVPLRKKGKLPHKTVAVEYALEYGSDAMEMHMDAIVHGERVMLVDDLIATGGTADAALKLLRGAAELVAAAFVVDLTELGGAELLRRQGVPTSSLVAFEGH